MQARLAAVKDVFSKMDPDGTGLVDTSGCSNAGVAKVLGGGTATWEEFVDYYAGLSAEVAGDEEYMAALSSAWGV